jgi:hypothetical protein
MIAATCLFHHGDDSAQWPDRVYYDETMRAVGCLLVALFFLGCHGCQPADGRIHVVVATQAPAATVSDRFLSLAVDVAQVVGGTFWNPGVVSGATTTTVPPYDFTRARLRALVQPLGHAYLRVGGTDADRTYYALSDPPPAMPPANYRWILTRAEWDRMSDFAAALDLPIVFTLNAGSGPRVDNGPWQPAQARALVDYAVQARSPVAAWELGNEANAYVLLNGFSLSPADYARDLRAARAMLDAAAPGSKLAAPASAYWPLVGEFGGLLPPVVRMAGDVIDIVSWHYYPQQSRRCGMWVRLATPTRLLDPDNLDEIDRWADDVDQAHRAGAPKAAVWLGETSNAQCGGAPGISDSFVSSLWWLDELGKMARRGTQVVARQSVSGADYGLLAEPSLDPRPDYFASLLWHRLMGTRALAVKSGSPTVRAYAHCLAGGPPGAVAVVLVNLDEAAPASLSLDGVGGEADLYLVTADGLSAPTARLNGQPLVAGADGSLPALDPVALHGALALPPVSYAFVTFRAAGASACR